MTEHAALVWTAQTLRVVTSSSELEIQLAVPRAERYGLQLSSDRAGRLYLRAVGAGHPFLVSSDRGRSFEPVPAAPADRPIPAHGYKVHPASGVLTALDRDRLWHTTTTTGAWQARELPPGMRVQDVSFDGQGGLWCAGSVDSRRIPEEETEAAVAYQAGPGEAFQPRSPHLSVASARRVAREGGLAEICTIDAESPPVVATSICSWFLDDSSSFVFVLDSGRTDVKRLKGEMICQIDRSPTALRVFTYEGGIWFRIGRAWKRSSIMASLVDALAISKRPVLVRALGVHRETVTVLLKVDRSGAGDVALGPEFTALCRSEDGGASFDVTRRVLFERDGEIVDLVLLD